MALIVEDGTGKSDAESYVSVADAIAWITKYYPTNDFLSKTTEEQEAYCRQSTQYLDQKYGGRWVGDKNSKEQALDWPRKNAVVDGYAVETDELPRDLEIGTFEAIIPFVAGDDPLAPQETPGIITEESATIGPISETTKYSGGKSNYKRYPKVDTAVRAIIEETDFTERS
jgi:hypothetical protein